MSPPRCRGGLHGGVGAGGGGANIPRRRLLVGAPGGVILQPPQGQDRLHLDHPIGGMRGKLEDVAGMLGDLLLIGAHQGLVDRLHVIDVVIAHGRLLFLQLSGLVAPLAFGEADRRFVHQGEPLGIFIISEALIV